MNTTSKPVFTITPQFIQEGLTHLPNVHYQYTPEQLIQQTVALGQGTVSDTGALVISTGAFTGRSPQDKFVVRNADTDSTVNWNEFNNPISEENYNTLYTDMLAYIDNKELWVRDCIACASPTYAINIRVVNENPWSNLFCYNMFIRPTSQQLQGFTTNWSIIQLPNFTATPSIHGTRSANFSIINFTQKVILIGGSGYTGEMKKGIFTVLNYELPQLHKVLSMHCSANIGTAGDTALYFGLSGTGKTTLSANPQRKLIGDDEHGWANNSIFNIEGGCYAKTINLSEDQEPDIFAAIKHGALVENTPFIPNTTTIDYTSKVITENTRVSYPLYHISNIQVPSIGTAPKNIFFLTCDSTGVLPPISKLTQAQAMYQFITGYTAKIAGTEAGVKEPKLTFSACFGAPFIPLHPGQYAALLGQYLQQYNCQVWLVNTGWSGGSYGTGQRMKLAYTRALINEALNGNLLQATYTTMPYFHLQIPTACAGVPSEILNPRNTWADTTAYEAKAKWLAGEFVKNFTQYQEGVSDAVLQASPVV